MREALGRALFRSRRFGEAAEEFEAVVERYPTNDYAHFCLGRSLDPERAGGPGRRHLAIAAEPAPRSSRLPGLPAGAASLLTTRACGRSSSGFRPRPSTWTARLFSRIGPGMVVLLGVAVDDTREEAEWIARKLRSLRIFDDAEAA